MTKIETLQRKGFRVPEGSPLQTVITSDGKGVPVRAAVHVHNVEEKKWETVYKPVTPQPKRR